ncbi:dephospho-CoA kinase [Candidatus Margulisiibacteriota bacterium]
MIIGLTGPIGAGKDTVAKILQRRGALVIDADKVAHTLYRPQSPVWRDLVKAFGSKVLSRGGEINRRKLAEIVFSDSSKLKQLNRIVHPYLKEEIIKVAKEPCIINAAVLKEIGLVDYVNEVWVVMASKEKRLKRLIKSGLDKEEAEKRIRSQMSQKEYLAMADVVIENNGTLKQLNAKIQACFKV